MGATGTITVEDVERSWKKAGVDTSIADVRVELKARWAKLSQGASKVDYEQFQKGSFEILTAKKKLRKGKSPSGRVTPTKAKAKFRKAVKKVIILLTPERQAHFRKQFDSLDRNATGTITIEDVERSWKKAGVDTSIADVRVELKARWAKLSQGASKVDYEQFQKGSFEILTA